MEDALHMHSSRSESKVGWCGGKKMGRKLVKTNILSAECTEQRAKPPNGAVQNVVVPLWLTEE